MIILDLKLSPRKFGPNKLHQYLFINTKRFFKHNIISDKYISCLTTYNIENLYIPSNVSSKFISICATTNQYNKSRIKLNGGFTWNIKNSPTSKI